MNEFEKLVNQRLQESYAKRIAERSCDECNCLMLDHHTKIGTLWCPFCGKEKDAPQS